MPAASRQDVGVVAAEGRDHDVGIDLGQFAVDLGGPVEEVGAGKAGRHLVVELGLDDAGAVEERLQVRPERAGVAVADDEHRRRVVGGGRAGVDRFGVERLRVDGFGRVIRFRGAADDDRTAHCLGIAGGDRAVGVGDTVTPAGEQRTDPSEQTEPDEQHDHERAEPAHGVTPIAVTATGRGHWRHGTPRIRGGQPTTAAVPASVNAR